MLIDVLRLSNNAAVDKKLTSLAPFRQAVARARDDSRAFSLTTAVSTSSLQKMTACSIFSSSGKVKVKFVLAARQLAEDCIMSGSSAHKSFNQSLHDGC